MFYDCYLLVHMCYIWCVQDILQHKLEEQCLILYSCFVCYIPEKHLKMKFSTFPKHFWLWVSPPSKHKYLVNVIHSLEWVNSLYFLSKYPCQVEYLAFYKLYEIFCWFLEIYFLHIYYCSLWPFLNCLSIL